MRHMTPAATSSANQHNTSEVWLSMLVLSHENWEDEVRLVRNNESITHQGEEYIAYPFDISLPNEESGTASVMEWVAANASQEVLAELRATSGPINAKSFWILASDPDSVVLGPYDLEMRSFTYNESRVTGNMQIEPILDAVFGHRAMNNTNAPALF